MEAVILVGGLGTRMRDIINDAPKPMVSIAGKPFLEYLVLHLKRYGVTEIILCTGYLGQKVREHFGDGRKWNVKIEYSEEKEPLGTGGAIKKAGKMIRGKNFLAMNGDSLFGFDVNKLIDFHLERNALATMALSAIDDTRRYGAVVINRRGEIESFIEKDQSLGSKLINGGVYVLSEEVFAGIPEGKVSLEEEVFPNIVGKGFFGMISSGYFIDIGIPKDYYKLLSNPHILDELSDL